MVVSAIAATGATNAPATARAINFFFMQILLKNYYRVSPENPPSHKSCEKSARILAERLTGEQGIMLVCCIFATTVFKADGAGGYS
jgi:hypothetical protein